MGSIGAAAVSSIGGILTLGGALGSVINMVAIAAPGMATGFIVGIGTLMVALKDFSKQLPEVVAQYKTLATTIRSNFWDEARNPIREMAQTLFPAFQAGLAETGAALGRWSSTVAKSLQDALMENGRLDTMFGFLNSSIDKATKGSGLMADSLVVLGEAGGAQLPRLADWFTQVSEKFNTFIREAAANGDLQFWIDSGIDRLKQLGSVIGETAGIFNSIEAAASKAGSDGLGTLLSFVTRVNDALKSPEGMQAMTTIFEGANTAASALGDGFFKITGALGSAAPAIKSAFESVGGVITVVSDAIANVISNPEFQAGFTAMFDGIEKGFGALMPVVGEMGPKFGAFLSIIGSLAANIGGVLGAALQVALPLVTAFKEAVDPLIPILGDALIRIIQSLAPLFQTLADTMVLLAPVVQVVVGVVADLIAGLAEGLGPALPGIVMGIAALAAGFQAFSAVGAVVGAFKAFSAGIGFLPTLLTTIRTAIGFTAIAFQILGKAMMANPIGLIIGAITALVAGFVLAYNNVGWFKDAVDSAVKWITEAFDGFLAFWNTNIVPMWNDAMKGAGEFFAGIGRWVGEAITNIQNFFGGFGKGAGDAGAAMGDFFTGIGTAITDFVGGVGEWFGGIGKGIGDAFNGAVGFVNDAFAVIGAAVTAFVTPIVEGWTATWTAVSDAFMAAWNGIVWFFEPLVGLIAAILKGAVDIILAIWQGVWDIVAAIFYGIWINLVAFFTPVIQTIVDTITNAVNWISATWTATWQAIGDFFTMIWNAIVAFVTPIVQSIVDTIVAVVTGVVAVWNAVWQGIHDFFAMVWNGILAFVTPIVQTISSVISSTLATISAVWNSVWGAISGFVASVWGTISGAVTNGINVVRAVVTGVVIAIQGSWNSTWSAISSFVSSVWSGIVSAVSGFVNSVRNNVQNVLTEIGNIGSRILSSVGNFGSLLISAGRDLINGLTSGITANAGAVVEKIKGIAAGALDAVKSFFGIKSPSRVMRDQVGKQLGAGLAIGIEASIGTVLKATDKLAKAAVPDIADIMLPAVRAASVTSQSMSRVSAPTPLSRETVTGRGTTYNNGYGALGTASTGPVTNVNFQVNPSQGLNETQIGEAAMEQLYWKLSTSL
jgi:phage-related protein